MHLLQAQNVSVDVEMPCRALGKRSEWGEDTRSNLELASVRVSPFEFYVVVLLTILFQVESTHTQYPSAVDAADRPRDEVGGEACGC